MHRPDPSFGLSNAIALRLAHRSDTSIMTLWQIPIVSMIRSSMAENLFGNNVVCQVAIVTEDIEATAKAWADLLGVKVPEWSLTGPKDETNMYYRGGDTDARAKLAFFNLGEQVRLELIEPNDEPSVWRDFLNEHGPSLHHVAFMVKGMDDVLARLDAKDIELVQRGDYTGGCYAYVDAQDKLGAILELLENY